MKYYSLFTLFIFYHLVSCDFVKADNAPLDSDMPAETEDTTIVEADTVDIVLEDEISNLNRVINSSFHFGKMKKEIGFLSMGWSIASKYLPEVPEGYKQYNYGAVGSLIRRPQLEITPSAQELRNDHKKFLSVITYKPWGTSEEKEYATDNELIIGFECRVTYKRLGLLNFVGLKRERVEDRFGKSDLIKEGAYVYKEDGKVLILHFENDSVNWSKFYKLDSLTFNSEEYPEELFKWNPK